MKYGDFHQWVTNNLHEMLTRIINAKSGRDRPYYILVIVKKGYDGPPANTNNELIAPDEIRTNRRLNQKFMEKNFEGKTVFSTRILILEPDKVPSVPMLGTSLWRIDNKIGEARCEYILPPDKPVAGGNSEQDSAMIADIQKKMNPFLYWSRN